MQRRTENISPRPFLLKINFTNVFVEEASLTLYKRVTEYILSTMRLNIVTKECPLSLNANLIGRKHT